MASCTAIEECEQSFTSPCSQVGCLHSSAREYDKRDQGSARNASLSTLDLTTAFFSDPVPDLQAYQVPDPVSRCPAAGSLAPGRSARLFKGGGKHWEQEPDKYVMKKCYRPGFDNDSQFKVFISETPILIAHLRPSEQNVAYDAILSGAPAHEIPSYYFLHLSRLANIRQAIASRTTSCQEEIDNLRRASVAERSTESLKTECVDGEKVDEAFRAYKRAFKEKQKVKACERGVMRLLERCEDILKGGAGFEPVRWRRSGGGG